MNEAVIGLGSNINPEKNIVLAQGLISSKFRIIKTSTFLKTAPQGDLQQPDFINGAVLIETPLVQAEVKQLLKGFESQMGRTNAMHCNKPRIIDFDIHVWNKEIVDPYFYKWDFLRGIVLELIPDLNYDQSKIVLS